MPPLEAGEVSFDGSFFRFYQALEQLRATGLREFPLQLAATYAYICSHEGSLQEDLPDAIHMSRSSVSRNVAWLGLKNSVTGKEGLRLVYRERDPDNYKKYRLYLTPKGKIFRDQIKNILFVDN
tara:strand:- start:277 stop:648 length:372 start_codon:yes stop_codon:yes gene_type:complete